MTISYRGYHQCRTLLLAFALSSTSVVALAQDTPPSNESDLSGPSVVPPGEDIVVTAQRRTESVQDVPISITALGRQSLDSRGVRSIDDLSKFAPGLNFSRTNITQNSTTNISIRGVSSNSGAGTTGIYIDDAPIQIRNLGYSSGNAYPQIFDLERVEVLRGPQGTLFGAGSEGGTVRFLLPTPSLSETQLYTRAELGFTQGGAPSWEAGAALGVPLVEDKVGIRLSVSHRRTGGYVDRVNYITGALVDKNANSGDVTVARAALFIKPSEDVSITPSIYFQKLLQRDSDTYWAQLSDPSKRAYRSGNAIASPNRDRFILPSLKIEAELGPVSLISSSSYLSRRQHATSDYTTYDSALFVGTPYFPEGAFSNSEFYNRQKSFTQEVRLQSTSEFSDRLTWVVGGFYQRAKQVASQNVPAAFLPGFFNQVTGLDFASIFGVGLVNGDSIYVQDPYQSLDRQVAAFGQVDFKLTSQLKLTAGLRYANAKFNGFSSKYGPVVGSATPLSSSGTLNEYPITPKFGLVYDFNRDNNVYLTAAKGFRIGGYNPRLPNTCRSDLASLGLETNPETFNSDSVWSYEIGSKNSFAGGKFRVNASVYQIDWKNIQQSVLLAGCGDNFVANLGSAKIRGGDLQIEARPNDALNLAVSVAYTHGEFLNTVYGSPSPSPNSLAVASAGDRVQGPPLQVSASGNYTIPIAGDKSGYLHLDYLFQSGEPRRVAGNNINNISYDQDYYRLRSSNVVNLRVGLISGALDASMFVNNLFDSDKPITLAHEARTSPLFRGIIMRPRTIGLTLTYRQ
ncbi:MULTISPECIES: TonB-dependent receptor [unclassified Sphingobium]|uniref:TonB-dependent receptor n=1 Tax=unclassified Sphingobium TaxID=2611147 RepID=UPI000D15160F|nr:MULTISPECIES: TonB-dependent receptor [unclassified Sphingobium]MBG6120433.1 outer membrane receptor protein involved in Fe transport [Sphingobium sp. JAI105]PSO10031.1 TonB-dependent receptor [Sphingobium sp. AEW4]TWC98925.1 outer membrane receptor protein involved in Fe transport [Sphingobium sp. AEW010]TWD18404.1 outer membrane receptor protein involved in Fe transport [Sphingobium sp. AEW013]TWD21032.1 outer membrane receptor protein involved in Fe transport [Sphingobium sp. AEW001]